MRVGRAALIAIGCSAIPFLLMSRCGQRSPSPSVQAQVQAPSEIEETATTEGPAATTNAHEARVSDEAEAIEPPIPLQLVWIPPDVFTLGSPPKEKGRSVLEGPWPGVTISRGFWLGKHEVTVGQYAESVKLSGGEMREELLPGGEAGLNKPVVGVSWDEAAKFCEELTRRARDLPDGYVYRLPTEAEWEYACRAGAQGMYNFANDPTEAEISAHVWCAINSESGPHRVGRKAPNAWGLHDMHGNALEWCLDFLVGLETRIDPVGSLLPGDNVVRGGAWHQPPARCRSAARRHCGAGAGQVGVGFRVALAPEIKEPPPE